MAVAFQHAAEASWNPFSTRADLHSFGEGAAMVAGVRILAQRGRGSPPASTIHRGLRGTRTLSHRSKSSKHSNDNHEGRRNSRDQNGNPNRNRHTKRTTNGNGTFIDLKWAWETNRTNPTRNRNLLGQETQISPEKVPFKENPHAPRDHPGDRTRSPPTSPARPEEVG